MKKRIVLIGKGAAAGIAVGEALVLGETISFLTDIDIDKGTIVHSKCTSKGRSIADKILVFPTGRGSTADPYGLYLLSKAGFGPKAVINISANPTTVAGAVISHIPMVYNLDKNPLEIIDTDDTVRVDGSIGEVVVSKK